MPVSQNYPDLLFERVRDHLERAAAILPNGPEVDPIRCNLEEAIEMALECAYRPRLEPPLRLLKADMLP